MVEDREAEGPPRPAVRRALPDVQPDRERQAAGNEPALRQMRPGQWQAEHFEDMPVLRDPVLPARHQAPARRSPADLGVVVLRLGVSRRCRTCCSPAGRSGLGASLQTLPIWIVAHRPAGSSACPAASTPCASSRSAGPRALRAHDPPPDRRGRAPRPLRQPALPRLGGPGRVAPEQGQQPAVGVGGRIDVVVGAKNIPEGSSRSFWGSMTACTHLDQLRGQGAGSCPVAAAQVPAVDQRLDEAVAQIDLPRHRSVGHRRGIGEGTWAAEGAVCHPARSGSSWRRGRRPPGRRPAGRPPRRWCARPSAHRPRGCR